MKQHGVGLIDGGNTLSSLPYLMTCLFLYFLVNVFDYNSSFLNTQAEGGGCAQADEMAVLNILFRNETFTFESFSLIA